MDQRATNWAHNPSLLWLLTLVGCASIAGCLDRDLKELNPCIVSGVSNVVPIQNVDKVDLLFVIDDSQSMKQEQELLRRELPALIRALATGKRRDGSSFSPVKDLHLGVVSTDLGTPGVQSFFTGCDALGEQGALLTRAAPDSTCAAQTGGPAFLSFQSGVDDPERVAADFQCIAMLGTDGCGLEQQLESMLRAVTPSSDLSRRFWGPAGMVEPGQADTVNAGFLRPAGTEPSLVAVILVTDEEDCSAANPAHFDPTFDGAPNLRCFENRANLHAIKRYVEGLRALRPGQEDLVLYSAIAGVPTDLVSDEVLAALDPERPEAFTAHYDRILADSRMQETPVVDPADPDDANLATSCETADGVAYPPRRIVEVARAFGPNGLVRSICESSFEGAIDSIVEAIVRHLPDVCLPFELVPNSDGLLKNCGVVWELPPQAMPGTITSCSELPYLKTPEDGPARSRDGWARCEVDQVAVHGGQLAVGQAGWYYDDFSEAVRACPGEQQRISFTEPPPSGARVTLECAREQATDVRVVEDALDSVPQPQPGSDCRDANGAPDATLCQIQRLDGSLDARMRCHPAHNVCVIPCQADADCPPAWRCDDRSTTLELSDGVAICVNPTCGD